MCQSAGIYRGPTRHVRRRQAEVRRQLERRTVYAMFEYVGTYSAMIDLTDFRSLYKIGDLPIL